MLLRIISHVNLVIVDNQWVFYIISLKGKKVFMVTRERWQGVLLFMQKKRLQTTTLVILHTHVCCFLPYFQLSIQAQSNGLGSRPKSEEPSSLFLRSGWKSLWSLWHVRLRVIKVWYSYKVLLAFSDRSDDANLCHQIDFSAKWGHGQLV